MKKYISRYFVFFALSCSFVTISHAVDADLDQEACKSISTRLQQYRGRIQLLEERLTTHENFLAFTFSLESNRNQKDFELIQAKYREIRGEITTAAFDAIAAELVNPVRLSALPTDLGATVGGTSAGLPAAISSASVTALAEHAGAALAPDPAYPGGSRRLSLGIIPASTIASAPAVSAELSDLMQKLSVK